MDQQNIPTELKISSKQVKNLAKRRVLADGWYAFLTTGSKRDVSKQKGTLSIPQMLWPLTDPADANTKRTPTIRDNMWMPWANPKVNGHKAPNTIGLCHSRLLAFGMGPKEIAKFAELITEEDLEEGEENRLDELEAIPDFPRKENGVLFYKGKEISADDEQEAREEVVGITLQMLAAGWKDPSLFDNYIVFGEVFDNNGFKNVRKISATLPDGEELLPVEKWDGGEEDDVEGIAAEEQQQEEAPAKVKKNGAKSAASKKGSTKKKR